MIQQEITCGLITQVLQEEDEDVVDDDYLDDKQDRPSRGGYIFAPVSGVHIKLTHTQHA